MTEPLWIPLAAAITIHDRQISRHGGAAGMRDIGLLEAALGRPVNKWGYGTSDLFELAAAYTFGIAKAHAFVDGNKRTAFQSAHQFLKDNGYQLEKSDGSKHADMMVQLGTGEISREDMGAYLSENAHEIVRDEASATSDRDSLLKDYEEQANRNDQDNGQDHDITGDD
jgi:death-on-curing protein